MSYLSNPLDASQSSQNMANRHRNVLVLTGNSSFLNPWRGEKASHHLERKGVACLLMPEQCAGVLDDSGCVSAAVNKSLLTIPKRVSLTRPFPSYLYRDCAALAVGYAWSLLLLQPAATRKLHRNLHHYPDA